MHVVADRGFVKAAETLLDPANRATEERSEKLTVKVNVLDGELSMQTPLHLAAWQGRVELCELLVKNSAYVDIADKDSMTPLNLAIMRNHKDVVQALIRLSADPHRKDKYGMHPLQQSCVSGSLEVLKLLKDLRLEPKLDDEVWRRPLALAKSNHHRELVHYLFVPIPKKLLSLALPRAISKDTVSVTFGAVVCEPECTSIHCQVAKKPPGPGRPDEERLFKSPEEGGGRLQEIEVEAAEILAGKTLQVSGLEEGSAYLLRLVGKNAAGDTMGGSVEVATKKGEEAEDAKTGAATRDRRGRKGAAESSRRTGGRSRGTGDPSSPPNASPVPSPRPSPPTSPRVTSGSQSRSRDRKGTVGSQSAAEDPGGAADGGDGDGKTTVPLLGTPREK